jgi:hypothetical protein
MASKRTDAALLLAALLVSGPCLALPGFAQVKAAWRASDVIVQDRHGQPLQRWRVDKQGRRQDWVSLADTSPALRQALVLSEDKRFYQHSGVDWSGVAAAAWGNLWNTRTRGASTLTMQLAGCWISNSRPGAMAAACGRKSARAGLPPGWSRIGARRKSWKPTSTWWPSVVSWWACLPCRPPCLASCLPG